MSLKIKSNGIQYNVPTIASLPTTDLEEGQVCVVAEEGRGGTFIYRVADAATNNGGTIFNGWTRQYDGAVEKSWFGSDALFQSFQIDGGSTTTPETLSNTVDDTKGISDEANFAGRTAGGFAPIGWIRHSYADGHLCQYDYVGTGGIINVWKNANNPTRRADKPSTFVGDGEFLRLLEHNLSGSSSHSLFRIDNDAVFEWMGGNPRAGKATATFSNAKTDDGFWGYNFLLTNPHDFSFNFDNMMRLQREVTDTRTLVNFATTNGVRYNALVAQYWAINNVNLVSLTPANNNLAMIGGGAFEYTSSSSGTVTQLTSKSTGVTLNTSAGQITMNNASLGAGTSVSFTLTNSRVSNTDTIIVNAANFAGYSTEIEYVANGATAIKLTNTTAGALTDAVLINFSIIAIS